MYQNTQEITNIEKYKHQLKDVIYTVIILSVPEQRVTLSLSSITHLIKVEQHFSAIHLISLQTHSLVHQQLLKNKQEILCLSTVNTLVLMMKIHFRLLDDTE